MKEPGFELRRLLTPLLTSAPILSSQIPSKNVTFSALKSSPNAATSHFPQTIDI